MLTGIDNIIGDRDSSHDTICEALLGDRDSSVIQIRHDGSNPYQLSENWPLLTAYNGSKPGGNKESRAANAIIEGLLKTDKRAEQQTIKFLFLGTMLQDL